MSDAPEREASESDVDHRFETVDALVEEIVKFEWIDLPAAGPSIATGRHMSRQSVAPVAPSKPSNRRRYEFVRSGELISRKAHEANGAMLPRRVIGGRRPSARGGVGHAEPSFASAIGSSEALYR